MLLSKVFRSSLIIIILLVTLFSQVQAQGSLPPKPSLPSAHEIGNGPIQNEDGTWQMPPTGDAASPSVAALAAPSAGPDDYGYIWDDAVSYDWIDVSGGTNTGMAGYSDGVGPISLPFDFDYYENTYNQIYISANGYITFPTQAIWGWQGQIPSPAVPNNMIAPYWTPLEVAFGSSIRYLSGGSEPNRYFVIEWHDVKDDLDNRYTFELILHENSDFVFQYGTMAYGSNGYTCAAAGIEDATGMVGLTYVDFCGQATSFDAVRFYRPMDMARASLTPLHQGDLVSPSATTDFSLTVRNTGDLGADVYDLTVNSVWLASLYAADGTTHLTDTDGDTIVDTGSISQGEQVNVIVRIQAPASAVLGDSNQALVTAHSSLDISRSKSASFQAAIPAPFVQVYMDVADGDMALELVRPSEQVHVSTAPAEFGNESAVASAPGANLVYAWNTYRDNGYYQIAEIKYALVSRTGTIVRATGKLVDHSSAKMTTYDSSPVLAIAPNGNIGITWLRSLYNQYDQHNSNVYFAILNPAGNVIYGPVNLTNNTAWDSWDTLSVPSFYDPTMTATGDGLFTIAWERGYNITDDWVSEIEYTVRNTAGSQVKAVTTFVKSRGYRPNLTALLGNRVLFSWDSMGKVYYAALDSLGNLVHATTLLTSDIATSNWRPDAVQLSDGKIVIAWRGSGVISPIRFAVLDSSYSVLVTPQTLDNPPAASRNDYVSVTADNAGHATLTWMDGDWSYRPNLYYALVNGSGAVLIDPMVIKHSQPGYIETSFIGYGNAAYPETFGDVPVAYWASSFIERLYNAGITGGCTTIPTQQYCPENTVTRAQMAIFLLKGIHGSSYSVPLVGDSTGFGDVATSHWAAAWVKQLAAEKITGGCGDGNYCPESAVTRAQMAVFLLKSKYGASYAPPTLDDSGSGFTDVPAEHWAAPWIKQLAAEGITGGCGAGVYCPEAAVTRAQMAVFLVKAFNLP